MRLIHGGSNFNSAPPQSPWHTPGWRRFYTFLTLFYPRLITSISTASNPPKCALYYNFSIYLNATRVFIGLLSGGFFATPCKLSRHGWAGAKPKVNIGLTAVSILITLICLLQTDVVFRAVLVGLSRLPASLRAPSSSRSIETTPFVHPYNLERIHPNLSQHGEIL